MPIKSHLAKQSGIKMSTTTIDPQYLQPITFDKLDSFTRAYITTALWSSTLDPFGTCPDCEQPDRVLNRWNQAQEHVCSECSEREPNYEPPAEDNYDFGDLAPETLARMRQDCATFQALYNDTIQAAIDSGEVKCGPDFDEWGRAGHDFWLTRCGHGAGFWDGDWPEPQAEHLTDAAHKCGNVDLYVGDDGKIYL